MSDHFDFMPKPPGWTPPVSNEDTPEPATPENTLELQESFKPEPSTEEPHGFEDTTMLERIITRCANVISWIFVPLLMPVYGIMLIFSLSFLAWTPMHTKVVFTLVVVGANFVVPMLLVLLLKKMGLIEDVGLNGRKERLIPYIITIVCLGGTGLFLYMKMAPIWVAMFYAGGALAALINLIVNFWWKISAHAAGIAGIVAMLIQITKEGSPVVGITWWIVGAIILAGMLGSARIWLGRHTLLQVLAGSVVGFLSVWTLSL